MARLASASPLYAVELSQKPWVAAWLEEPRNLREPFRFRAFMDTWGEFAKPAAGQGDEARVGALRRWRRLMSMRIAHRSVNGLADEPATVEELTILAEFCLRECLAMSLRRWKGRIGEPWDQAAGSYPNPYWDAVTYHVFSGGKG